MAQPDPAVAACRLAVRRALAAWPQPCGAVLVACSGGRDSLALAASLAFEADRARRGVPGARSLRAGALIVDHGLQPGSAHVAEQAAAHCRALGLETTVTSVQVEASGSGPEAAARAARYAAMECHASQWGADVVLLGHTRDDQAEQVLLGMTRGSGLRSLAGMAAVRGPFVRPFLQLSRVDTERACRALNLRWWDDPHNADPSFTRVRVRALLEQLRAELGPGVVSGLVRTAEQARTDADALDHYAEQAFSELGELPWDVTVVAALPAATRHRVWLRLARRLAGESQHVASVHVGALDALVSAWTGQGPVSLPRGVHVGRREGWIVRLDAPLTKPGVCP